MLSRSAALREIPVNMQLKTAIIRVIFQLKAQMPVPIPVQSQVIPQQ